MEEIVKQPGTEMLRKVLRAIAESPVFLVIEKPDVRGGANTEVIFNGHLYRKEGIDEYRIDIEGGLTFTFTEYDPIVVKIAASSDMPVISMWIENRKEK